MTLCGGRFRRGLAGFGWICALGWPAAASAIQAPAAPPAPAAVKPAATGENWPEVRDATFGAVWETVNRSYFDPTFGGVDWAAVRTKYGAELAGAKTKEALRGLLRAMLGELQRTHFAILDREAAVFTVQDRTKEGVTGITVVPVDGVVAILRIAPDSPAARAGLRPGMVVTEIGGLSLDQLRAHLVAAEVPPNRRAFYLAGLVQARLLGPVGTTADFTCGPPGGGRAVKLTRVDFPGRWSEPVGQFPSEPLECVTQLNADGIAYARFNVFSPMLMADLKHFLRSIPATDGLVIDLRGNPGGLSIMASGLCGWLSDREFSLGTMRLREGRSNFIVYPQTHAFLGPVAVLIDQRSASTSEIFAAGLQEAGRARVFGETSAGAALPSQFEDLPDGDIFQYAIADARTPRGMLIEGHGVTPDDVVAPTLADLAAGRDPALAAAEVWLNERRRAAREGDAVNFSQPLTP